MGLFDKLINRDESIQSYNDSSSGNVLNIEFSGFSKSNRDIALKLSALYAGTNLIS